MFSDRTRHTIGLTQEITNHVYLPTINCSASSRAALESIIPFNYEDDAFLGLLTMADRIYATVDESVRLGDRLELVNLILCITSSLRTKLTDDLDTELWLGCLVDAEFNNTFWVRPWHVELPQ